MTGITLDYETADRIALLALKDHLQYLEDEVKEHEENGQYMHPRDYDDSKTKLIPALRVVIDYYGGSL